ncbi:hypothetical protein RISK_002297 [Rhodopirellula islandica]|uniref:Uncharacterized protein n=1 Tax=Rhodopirellula islandica TaxID=595434 RepID=A0A0J1BGK2_RHOIS|nr:hypothetical protein RISK_002297 [Rhodopirellula islandica]
MYPIGLLTCEILPALSQASVTSRTGLEGQRKDRPGPSQRTAPTDPVDAIKWDHQLPPDEP